MEPLYLQFLMKELHQHKFQVYTNKPGKQRQSSVAIIFRISAKSQKLHKKELEILKKERIGGQLKRELLKKDSESLVNNGSFTEFLPLNTEFEILFIQRAVNARDVHSGQLAFPGGQNDNDEVDLEAAIRETQQEVGLDLLSKMPRNYYVRRTSKGELLYVSPNYFFILPFQETDQFVLSAEEVAVAKWIPFRSFIDPDFKQIETKRITNPPNLDQVVPRLVRPLMKKGRENLLYFEYVSLNIEMDAPLWGLTFYIMIFTLQVIFEGIQQQKTPPIFNHSNHYESMPVAQKKQESKFDQLDTDNMSVLIQSALHFKTKFKDGFWPAPILNYFFMFWFNQQRKAQFTYMTKERQKERQMIQTSRRVSIGMFVMFFFFYVIFRLGKK